MSEQHAQARHALYWLPNALTVSRILLIPVLVWALIASTQFSRVGLTASTSVYWIAFIIFIYCMLTDFFDGYFARKFNLTSDFGRMLDPIADKLLVAASLIAIMISNYGEAIIAVPALIIIGRDIFVSGIREHAANSNIVLSPTKLAKWKTTFEMIAILLYISAYVFKTAYKAPGSTPESGWVMYPPLSTEGPNAYLLLGFLGTLWLAAILSAYTGFHYFRSAMRKA